MFQLVRSRADWYGKVAVVAFAKNPDMVPVKTRLARSIGADAARIVYSALLEDCLTSLCSIQGTDKFIACFPDEHGDFFDQARGRHGIGLVSQEGRDLGERMLNCATALLNDYQVVIIFGSDVPVLPVSSIQNALNSMHFWDVILGPSRDGGYYAIGFRHRADSIFTGLTWGTESVFLETVKNCSNSGLEVAFLDVLDDIDDLDSLLRLSEALEVDADTACHTRLALREIGLVEGLARGKYVR